MPGDVKGGRYVSCVRDVRLGSADDSGGIVQGPTGPQGPAGPQGAKGDPGAPGRDAVVTCRIAGSAHAVRVSCTVRLKGHARLTRNGRTYASGSAKHLRATRRLTRGARYTLRVGAQKLAVRLA